MQGVDVPRPGLPRAFDVNFVIPLLVNDDDVCWSRLKLRAENVARTLKRNSKIFRTYSGKINERFYRHSEVPSLTCSRTPRITKDKNKNKITLFTILALFKRRSFRKGYCGTL